jgi:hypothetical protein
MVRHERAGSRRDPTGAVYSMNEALVAAPVEDRRGRPGLLPLAVYLDSDVAMAVGREVYGYPKKLATVTIGDGKGSVVRDGLRPGEPPGRVHALSILRATWTAGAGGLSGTLRQFGAQGLARLLGVGRKLVVYNHQSIPTPPGLAGALGLTRVLASPLTDVRIDEAAPLSAASLSFEPSTLDPLHRLTPPGRTSVEARVGVRLRVRFTVNEAEVVEEGPRLHAASLAPGAPALREETVA